MRFPRPLRSITVGALLLLSFEVAARQFGWLDPTEREDPYLGFPGTSPLYRVERATAGTEVYRRSPNKGSYREAEFPVDKSPREFRVFCIGGSSVRSDAFMSPDASFPHLLEVYLGGLLAERAPRVLNGGGGGAGSVQNLEVAREVLDEGADLLVIYPEGGEKNLVPPLPQSVMALADDAHPARAAARRELAQLRLYQAVRDGYRALMPSDPAGGGAASAFSAFALSAVSRPFSKDTFTRLFEFKTDRAPVLMPHLIAPGDIAHAHERFTRNLAAMAQLAHDAGVPILFVQPVRNLKASFYLRFHIDPSEIRGGDVDGWRRAWEAGLAAKRAGRCDEAVTLLRSVRDFYVEDRDEILAFDVGECLERLGRFDEAQAEYAKPYLEHPMRRLIAEAAAQSGVPLVDPYPRLLQIADHGLPGYDLFTDAFHPMPATNRVIALAVLDAIREQGWGGKERPPGDPAQADAERRVQKILDGSPPPLHNPMLRAILSGNEAEAVRLGRTMPEDKLIDRRLTESLYLGWALTRVGDLAGAQKLFAQLRAKHWRPGAAVPPLDTDEDMVRNAFGGDLFAWF
jgi:hypothetical protein